MPQGRHGHGLLRRGALTLDEFFPGILNEVATAGAPVRNDGDLAKIYFSFNGRTFTRSGTTRDNDSLGLLAASRPFLEFHVRRRLAAVPNVTVLAGYDFVDMTATADGTRITGVHAHQPQQRRTARACGRPGRRCDGPRRPHTGRPENASDTVAHPKITS